MAEAPIHSSSEPPGLLTVGTRALARVGLTLALLLGVGHDARAQGASPPLPTPLAQRSGPVGSLLQRLLALPKARPRIAHLSGDIALVEVRGVAVDELEDFERALLAEALLLPGV